MKNILVIQSRHSLSMIASEQEGYRRAIGTAGTGHFISSLDTSLDWKDPKKLVGQFDAVILGGSGDFDFDGGREHDDVARVRSQEITERLRTLILFAIEEDFPLLGICFGHQIVSEVLGVRVFHDHTQKKVGSHEINLTDAGKKDKLFSILPESFIAQYGHKDSLSTLPEGATLLACSACCKTSALRFGSKVYTMQFHPEMTHHDVVWKLSNSPGYLPEGVNIESVVRPSPEASTIIPRFLTHIVG